jgi:hypothetical protein
MEEVGPGGVSLKVIPGPVPPGSLLPGLHQVKKLFPHHTPTAMMLCLTMGPESMELRTVN